MGSPNVPKSVRMAERGENARMLRMQESTNRINRMFDSPARQQQDQDYLSALRNQDRFGADQAHGEAARARRALRHR